MSAKDTDTSAPRINWGIIGCGDVVERKAASGILAAGQCIVSAMRNDEKKLAAFGNKFSVEHLTTDANEVIHHPQVDMVYIATAPDLHLHYAREATAAGKGILIEKPVGRCAAETREILQHCQAANVAGYPSYYRRYQPKYQKVLELLQSGIVGSLVAVNYTFRERHTADDGWRGNPAKSGGGAFYDLGGHVLDVIDLVCGPLTFISGDAQNLKPDDVTEHFAQLHFRGRSRDGASVSGAATWNFAAIDKQDELIFECQYGRIRCSGLKQPGSVVLEVDQTLKNTWKGSIFNRTRKKLRNRYWPLKKQRWQFAKPKHTHAELFAHIGRTHTDPALCLQHLEAAVRSTELMDGALTAFYGNRAPGFWEHADQWRNLRGLPRQTSPTTIARYKSDVTSEHIEQFQTQGYAGPFDADVSGIDSLRVPEKERKDVHLNDAQFFRLSTHPSITARVAALVGSDDLSIFKSRIHTKVGFTTQNQPKHAIVPWHQDVGDRNGGYDKDGNPIATYTVWLALDDVGADAGPLCVLPGTQNTLYGDFEKNFHAELLASGAITHEDINNMVPLTMKRGQFVVFHSWLLHGSAPNETAGRRSGFNLRYVINAQRGTEEYPYVDLSPLALNNTQTLSANGE